MKGAIGDKQRLVHITEIEKYTASQSVDEFLVNSMMRFASVKQIEIIGEAANLITPQTKALFTDLDWRKVIGMRHILVHEYFGIDFPLIWQVIITDLPDLKQQVEGVLAAFD